MNAPVSSNSSRFHPLYNNTSRVVMVGLTAIAILGALKILPGLILCGTVIGLSVGSAFCITKDKPMYPALLVSTVLAILALTHVLPYWIAGTSIAAVMGLGFVGSGALNLKAYLR